MQRYLPDSSHKSVYTRLWYCVDCAVDSSFVQSSLPGVFILVGAGIVGGVGLIIIEIIYKKHQTRKQRRMELARHAANKWRGAVEVSRIPYFTFAP